MSQTTHYYVPEDSHLHSHSQCLVLQCMTVELKSEDFAVLQPCSTAGVTAVSQLLSYCIPCFFSLDILCMCFSWLLQIQPWILWKASQMLRVPWILSLTLSSRSFANQQLGAGNHKPSVQEYGNYLFKTWWWHPPSPSNSMLDLYNIALLMSLNEVTDLSVSFV